MPALTFNRVGETLQFHLFQESEFCAETKVASDDEHKASQYVVSQQDQVHILNSV